MNNLSFSKKFLNEHDNGIRELCWIPIENRNPPVVGAYLVTLSNNQVGEVGWDGTQFKFDNPFELTVIAWAKLPTPYKPD